MDFSVDKHADDEQLHAWILDVGQDIRFALAFHEMKQVLLETTVYQVPCAPLYCKNAVIIDNRVLPVIDIPALFDPALALPEPSKTIGIAIYQDEPGAPLKDVGIQLSMTPDEIIVNDEMSCDLPEDRALWKDISMSCFRHEKRLIPVIDLAYLFSADFRDRMNT